MWILASHLSVIHGNQVIHSKVETLIYTTDSEKHHTTFSHIREYKFNIKLNDKHRNKLLESLSSY